MGEKTKTFLQDFIEVEKFSKHKAIPQCLNNF